MVYVVNHQDMEISVAVLLNGLFYAISSTG